MTLTPDRQYDDRGRLVAMRRPNWALEAEARCAHVKPEPPADYTPEFGDIRIINPSLSRRPVKRGEPDEVEVRNGEKP